MRAHWLEKEDWMNGGNGGWSIKQEVLDGTRFSELAWFWNLDEKCGVCLQDVSPRVAKILAVQKKYYRHLQSLMEVENCIATAAAPDLIITLSMLMVIRGI